MFDGQQPHGPKSRDIAPCLDNPRLYHRSQSELLRRATPHALCSGLIHRSRSPLQDKKSSLPKHTQAFLTHNGELLGPAFPGIRCIKDAAALYPFVGLHGHGVAVRLNFGQQPYKFDLSAYMAEEDSREQAVVDAIPVCPSLIRALVRDYLLHQVREQAWVSYNAWTRCGRDGREEMILVIFFPCLGARWNFFGGSGTQVHLWLVGY